MTRLLAWTVQFVLCVSVFCLGATAKDGPKRVALVIGNSSYEFTSTLTNPRNDAEDLSKLLAKLGFEVVSGVDLDKSAMERLIRSFAEKMSGAKLGVFFYAGHGLQVGGQNYLVPTDAKLTSAIAVPLGMYFTSGSRVRFPTRMTLL